MENMIAEWEQKGYFNDGKIGAELELDVEPKIESPKPTFATNPREALSLFRNLRNLEKEIEILEQPRLSLRQKIKSFLEKEQAPDEIKEQLSELLEKFVLKELL